MSNKTQCAIYTRISTSNQAKRSEFTSCESQEDKIRSFAESQDNWQVDEVYSDSGYTGANTDRPDLQKLLKDLEEEKFDAVVVYKIDRLTRSPKDFYQLIEFFEQKDIDFVSITERFDTAKPSGRLLRNTMLTFAQFEREIASERTKDKMVERAKKGFWNGGTTPFGYKKEDKKLVIDASEAKIIRTIFEKYLEEQSLGELHRFLREEDIKSRDDNYFHKAGLKYILNNPVYTGKVRYDEQVYDGKHEAIVSEEVFNLAQKIHEERKEKYKKKFKVYKDFLFGGIIKCRECNSSMTPCFTNKYPDGELKRYYYYRCTLVDKEGWDACSIKQVSATRLEKHVLESLKRISNDEEYLRNLVFRLNHDSDSPHRVKHELSGNGDKYSKEAISSTLNFFLSALSDKEEIAKNLLAKKFIKELTYSKEKIEISFYYKKNPGKLKEKKTPDLLEQVGEQKSKKKSIKKDKLSDNELAGQKAGGQTNPSRTFSIILPNPIHHCKKKNLD